MLVDERTFRITDSKNMTTVNCSHPCRWIFPATIYKCHIVSRGFQNHNFTRTILPTIFQSHNHIFQKCIFRASIPRMISIPSNLGFGDRLPSFGLNQSFGGAGPSSQPHQQQQDVKPPLTSFVHNGPVAGPSSQPDNQVRRLI